MFIPYPFGSPSTFLFIWIIAIALFQIKIFISKSVLLIYLFIQIYFIFSLFVWQDRTMDYVNTNFLRWIMVRQIGFALLGILMIQFFFHTMDFYGLALISLVTILFIVVSSLIFMISPSYAENYMQVRGSLKSEGINSYSFFSSLVFLAPVVAYYIKSQRTNVFFKILFFGLWTITAIATAMDSRTTAFLFTIVYLIIPLISNTKKSVKLIITMSILLIFVFSLFKLQLVSSINYLANMFVGTTLESRLSDFATAIEISDFDFESDRTYTSGVRLNLLYESIKSFFINPLIGGGRAGGHSFWVDILGIFGIIGFIPWILIIQSQIKKNLSVFSDNYKPFYILSAISFLTFGIFKSGLQDPQFMVSFFFLVPALYYLETFRKKNITLIQGKKS